MRGVSDHLRVPRFMTICALAPAAPVGEIIASVGEPTSEEETVKHSGRIQLEIQFVGSEPARLFASDVWWEHGWLIYKEHGSGTGDFVAIPAENIRRIETSTPPL